VLFFFESTCADARVDPLFETSNLKPFFTPNASIETQLWQLEQLIFQHCTASSSTMIKSSILEGLLKKMSYL
jgi:hypothetical protein